EWDFVCVADGSSHVVKNYGEAMDSSDKSTNKAMSAAYKYAVIHSFSIPVQGEEDADSTTVEVAAPKHEALPERPKAKAVKQESAREDEIVWRDVTIDEKAPVVYGPNNKTRWQLSLDNNQRISIFDKKVAEKLLEGNAYDFVVE